MRPRALLTAVLGVFVAGSAVVYSHAFLKTSVERQPMRDVVVVTDNISFGQVITSEMLTIQAWPAQAVPSGSFSSLEQVVGEGEGRERRAKFSLADGDIVLQSKISDFGKPVSITQKIDPQMRAVTIPIKDITGVAGFIAPADRIDLTLTRNVDRNLVTSTLLQDVEVLGVDQPAGRRGGEPGKIRSVTVQVEPADAQKLALARQAGTLSVSLRHIDAADQPALDSISVSDLTAPGPAKPKPKTTERGLPSIVVNRGGQRSTVEVPSG